MQHCKTPIEQKSLVRGQFITSQLPSIKTKKFSVSYTGSILLIEFWLNIIDKIPQDSNGVIQWTALPLIWYYLAAFRYT